jgi:hypothetical protein
MFMKSPEKRVTRRLAGKGVSSSNDPNETPRASHQEFDWKRLSVASATKEQRN